MRLRATRTALGLLLAIAGGAMGVPAAAQSADAGDEALQSTEVPDAATTGSEAPSLAAESDPPTVVREVATVPRPEPPPDESDAPGCTPQDSGDEFVGEVRDYVYRNVCAAARWFDGFFGSNETGTPQSHEDAYGRLSVGFNYSEYDGFDPKVRLRARLPLPQAESRLHAIVGIDRRDDFLAEQREELGALPGLLGSQQREDLFVGLGLGRDQLRSGFDASVGLRIDAPLDPYIKGSYQLSKAFAGKWNFRARETVFWDNSDGLGTSQRFDLDYAFSNTSLLRLGGFGKFAEETLGYDWNSELTLYRSTSPKLAIAYQLGLDGETDNPVPIQSYGARVILRKRMRQEWFYTELRFGVDWPRERLDEKREASLGVGLAFEIQFGDPGARQIR